MRSREGEGEGDEMGAAERREERGRERVLLAIRALFAVNTPKRACVSIFRRQRLNRGVKIQERFFKQREDMTGLETSNTHHLIL